MQTYCGTPITMAPEILERKGYSDNCRHLVPWNNCVSDGVWSTALSAY